MGQAFFGGALREQLKLGFPNWTYPLMDREFLDGDVALDLA